MTDDESSRNKAYRRALDLLRQMSESDVQGQLSREGWHVELSVVRAWRKSACIEAFVPPRTDQEWWHQLHVHSRGRCCCLRPRVAFEAPAGVRASSPSFSTVLWEVTQRAHALPLVHVWR